MSTPLFYLISLTSMNANYFNSDITYLIYSHYIMIHIHHSNVNNIIAGNVVPSQILLQAKVKLHHPQITLNYCFFIQIKVALIYNSK